MKGKHDNDSNFQQQNEGTSLWISFNEKSLPPPIPPNVEKKKQKNYSRDDQKKKKALKIELERTTWQAASNRVLYSLL